MAGDTKDKVDSQQKAESRKELEKWLNKSMKIRMTDGRTLVGIFLCTDCDCNIIMGACEEYLKPLESLLKEDPRILGLAMVPGKHVVSIDIDESQSSEEDSTSTTRNNSKDAQDNLVDDDDQSVGDNIQNPEEENVAS